MIKLLETVSPEEKQNKEHHVWSGFMADSSADRKRISEEREEGGVKRDTTPYNFC